MLFVPPPAPPDPPAPTSPLGQVATPGRSPSPPQPQDTGPYAMCYAVSASADPLGPYYRYEFLRPLFPDYPRPASLARRLLRAHEHGRQRDPEARLRRRSREDAQGRAGDRAVRDHRRRQLPQQRRSRRHALPPAGAPNIMMAAGGTQLKNVFEDDDGIYVWKFHVDWKDPAKTKVTGPVKIAGGAVSLSVRRPADQLRAAARHRPAARRAGRQDHGAARVPPDRRPRIDRGGALGEHRGGRRRRAVVRVPRRQEPRRAVSAGHLCARRLLPLDGQPGDRSPGQHRHRLLRSAARRTSRASGSPARLAGDPPGQLTLRETVLVEGEAAQTNTLRWEDYTQTAIDPSDDCTIWYVGDYVKKDATSYSTRIGAFRMPPAVPRRPPGGGMVGLKAREARDASPAISIMGPRVARR